MKTICKITCFITFLFFCNTSLLAAERSCSATSVNLYGKIYVGSIWKHIFYELPDSILKTITSTRPSAEQARKRACKLANEYTIENAKSRYTKREFAKLLCRKARSSEMYPNENAGRAGVKLLNVQSYTSREYDKQVGGLGNTEFNCSEIMEPEQISQSILQSNNADSQFCQDYATTAIKMDLAREQLGCDVQHAERAGHQRYCGERTEQVVLAGIRQKRGLLNSCIDNLPLR